MAKETETKKPKTGGRSPSFPYVDLEEAIKIVRKINEEEHGHACSREVAFGHIGLSAKSGPGRRTLAALKAFDLVKVKGDNLELTPLAHRIVDDERPVSPERTEAIQKAALSPPIHIRLWEKYQSNLPSEAQLRHYLVWEEGFNKKSVDDFIGEYKRTLDFAKVEESASTSEDVDDEDLRPPAVGDFVQWESQGVEQFPTPRRVRAVQESETEEPWVFVDGSTTGIPAAQLTVVTEAPNDTLVKQPGSPAESEPPTLPLPLEHADTYLLTIPFKGKPLSVKIHLPGEDLGSEHFKKVSAHLKLLIDDSGEDK